MVVVRDYHHRLLLIPLNYGELVGECLCNWKSSRLWQFHVSPVHRLLLSSWWVVVGSNEDYAAGNIIKAHSLLLSITAPSVQSGISWHSRRHPSLSLPSGCGRRGRSQALVAAVLAAEESTRQLTGSSYSHHWWFYSSAQGGTCPHSMPKISLSPGWWNRVNSRKQSVRFDSRQLYGWRDKFKAVLVRGLIPNPRLVLYWFMWDWAILPARFWHSDWLMDGRAHWLVWNWRRAAAEAVTGDYSIGTEEQFLLKWVSSAVHRVRVDTWDIIMVPVAVVVV